MSAGLMIEVVKYAPKSLTAVEWKALMVLADDANDKTRLVFTDIENQKFLDEMDVEANRWRSIRAALKRKGVIVQESAGFKGHCAKFRIVPLRPAEEPDSKERGNDAPFESEGARNPTQRSADSAPQTEPKTRGNEAQRRADSARPTPPTPQNQEHSSEPPPPGDVHPDWLAPESEGAGVQGEGEGWEARNDTEAASPVVDSVADDSLMHQAVLFVDKLPFDQRPTNGERNQLVHLAGLWFAEGWTHEALMAKCESNLGDVRNRISVWINHRLPEQRVTKPPKLSESGHQTYQDPATSAYGPPKREHVGWQNPTDPDAYEGTF